MFATLAGDYPHPAGEDPSDALRAVVLVQARTGIALLSDGSVHGPLDDIAEAWRRASACAGEIAPGLLVKVAVRGPWSANVRDPSTLAACAAALRDAAAAGCPYIEVHEPAERLPRDEAGFGAFAELHAALLAGLPDGVHASLAITGGNADRMPAGAVFGAPYASYLFDVLAGPDNWRLIAVAPPDRGIVLGVVDAAGRRRIGLEEITWAVGYAASTGGRGRARVGVAPSGGLAGLDPDRAEAVLALLGSAVSALSGDRDALLDQLDPRAIDARTAALGHAARPRRSPAPPAGE